MRDLDSRDLVSGDFLVVSGDVISNLNLEPAMARHRARREKDKNAIMTMILREIGFDQRPKNRRRRPVFVIDPKAQRCLHYEEIGGKRGGKYVTLDPDFLTAHDEIEIREDLADPYIDICTAEVLAQWSDNFDYQSLRKSFLFGVLKDYELNGKTIHTHIVRDRYAARVGNLRAYDSISKDILGRWTYHLCPDSNLMDGQTYRLRNAKTYQEDGVRLGKDAIVRGRCAFGKGTAIGERSVISNSLLGRQCRIGNDVHIEDACLWHNVVVEDNVKIKGPAIIANDVKVRAKSTIEPGATIASQTTIEGRETTAEPEAITKDAASTTNPEDDSDVSSNASFHLAYQNPSASTSQSSISTFASSDAGFGLPDTSRRSSFRSDPSEETIQNRDFQVEATASILDGLTNGDAPDTIFLELNSYRMSVDVSQHEVRQAVVTAVMRRIAALSEGSGSPREAVKQVFCDYRSLVERIILDKDAEVKGDQVDFLLLVQKDVVRKPNGGQMLLFVAKEAYDLDVVEEDGVLQWWEEAKSGEGEMGRVRGLTEAFVTFLREAEEDEDSDEEEEGSE